MKHEGPSPASPGRRARRYEGVVASGTGERADRYISECLGLLSRSQLKARKALVSVDGREVKLSRILKGGERITVEWEEEPSQELVPEEIALSVLYEDGRVIVIDKAQGMVTHPGHGNRRGTLANALLGRLAAAGKGGSGPDPAGAVQRAGIVHRLDKDTSGVIIAAKDAEAQAFLSAQFKDRLTRKEYLAVTKGIPEPREGRIENRLGRDPKNRKRFAVVVEGGKPALTDYRVLASFGGASSPGSRGSGYALVSLRPRTGRTHQLRVHLASLGTPILGDPIYGGKDQAFPGATLMLHAYRLRICLPGSGEASLFRAPVPERFRRLVAYLEKRYGKNK